MTKPTPTDQPSHSGKPRSSFSGKMGYVLAVAGSAVGLGTFGVFPIWRPNTEEGFSFSFIWS